MISVLSWVTGSLFLIGLVIGLPLKLRKHFRQCTLDAQAAEKVADALGLTFERVPLSELTAENIHRRMGRTVSDGTVMTARNGLEDSPLGRVLGAMAGWRMSGVIDGHQCSIELKYSEHRSEPYVTMFRAFKQSLPFKVVMCERIIAATAMKDLRLQPEGSVVKLEEPQLSRRIELRSPSAFQAQAWVQNSIDMKLFLELLDGSTFIVVTEKGLFSLIGLRQLDISVPAFEQKLNRLQQIAQCVEKSS